MRKVWFESCCDEEVSQFCFNCGNSFEDALTGKEQDGDFVVCSTCSGRGAYVRFGEAEGI